MKDKTMTNQDTTHLVEHEFTVRVAIGVDSETKEEAIETLTYNVEHDAWLEEFINRAWQKHGVPVDIVDWKITRVEKQ